MRRYWWEGCRGWWLTDNNHSYAFVRKYLGRWRYMTNTTWKITGSYPTLASAKRAAERATKTKRRKK